jgi:hypothetical protein
MKQILTIIKEGKKIYDGKILNIPIKEESIINKSIELFDDEDPCIIHQSYVVKEYVTELLSLFGDSNEIKGIDFSNQLKFIDLKDIDLLTFHIKG